MFDHVNVELPERKVQTDESTGKRYYIIDGVNVNYPSVTTVVNHENEEFFAEWRKNPENAKMAAQAAARGNKYHNLVEDYLNNKKIESIPLFESSKFKLDKINNIRALEDPLWGDVLELIRENYGLSVKGNFGVAGRVDCIAEYEGQLAVIDFKTAKRPKNVEDIEGYLMQATCYSLLWEGLTGEKIHDGVIIMACDDLSCSVYKFRTKKLNRLNRLVDIINSYQQKYGRQNGINIHS
jgi:genome maintenance exonuclease 1